MLLRKTEIVEVESAKEILDLNFPKACGDFFGCSRHWAESATSEGPDDHFTKVLSIFSIEKYRVLALEKM